MDFRFSTNLYVVFFYFVADVLCRVLPFAECHGDVGLGCAAHALSIEIPFSCSVFYSFTVHNSPLPVSESEVIPMSFVIITC